MFRHEGTLRSERQNRLLAGFLASMAGFVNSAGFILIGAFTSHATGNVGRLADDVARGDGTSAIAAGLLLATFFAGALLASLAIEARMFSRLPYTYAMLLAVEAGLFAAFLGTTHVLVGRHTWDLSAGLLCGAMGLQNSLVTRISGAVVRTTHLTGTLTDLGIEAARWLRFWRASVERRTRLRLSLGGAAPERPSVPKVTLLATILGAFVLGSVAGAFAVHWFGHAAMVVPMGLASCGAIYAVTNGQVSADDRA